MSKYIILRKVLEEELQLGIFDLEDVTVCYSDGEMKFFDSKSEAQTYLSHEEIEGQILKLKLDRSDFSNEVG